MLLVESDVKTHQEATDIPEGTLISNSSLRRDKPWHYVKKRIPERVSNVAFQGIGIFTIFLGRKTGSGNAERYYDVFLNNQNHRSGIDEDVSSLGIRLVRFAAEKSRIMKAFSQQLSFLYGAMAILGSLEDGISGNYHILMTKSVWTASPPLLSVPIESVSPICCAFISKGRLHACVFRNQVYRCCDSRDDGNRRVLIVRIGINMLGIKRSMWQTCCLQ